MMIRNSHIEESPNLTVEAFTIAGEHVDLAGNWWGTTDTARIWSKIVDPNGTVTIDPIAERPLGRQVESIGSLKAAFGPE